MTCVRKIGSGSQIRAGLSGYVADLGPDAFEELAADARRLAGRA